MSLSGTIPVQPNSEKGIRLLSLDGGPNGIPLLKTVRSLCAHVLDEENRVRVIRGELEQTVLPKPCEYFDMIGGSGSGGIVALMIGTLRMGIDEATTAYYHIFDQVNSSTTDSDSKTSQNSRSKTLEKELKKLVEGLTQDAEALLCDSSQGGGSKTSVTAIHSRAALTRTPDSFCARNERNLDANALILFRSYDFIHSVHNECKIWEAGCATSATPGIFDSMAVGGRGPFIGGSWGCSNPTQVVLEEAASVFPGRKIACVVSIGTGHPKPISLFKSPLTEVAMQIATDCQHVHDRVSQLFANQKSLYHRFNVEQGLQMTDRDLLTDSAEVEAHTCAYLSSTDVQLTLPGVAKLLVQSVGKVDPNHLLSAPPPLPQGNRLLIRPIPPSRAFTGRKDMLHVIKAALFTIEHPQRQKRFVLYGLGGSGKTQIALEFLLLHSARFTKKYLINASSEKTINTALENIGLDLGLPEPTASDTLDLLCRLDEDWFLLYNNVDDPSVNLHKFFPPCSHGYILVTSRNQQSGNYSQPSTSAQEVLGMNPEDSVSLLISLTSQRTLDTENKALLPAVADMLGHLALALVQCGSYVASSPGMTFRKYMNIFTIRRKDLLSRKLTPPVDLYKCTVYATWVISFEALTSPAKSLLNICSFFHFDGITADIFSHAALNVTHDKHLQDSACFSQGVEFLNQFAISRMRIDNSFKGLDADEQTNVTSDSGGSDTMEAAWDDFQLRETMAELTSYSLMQQSQEGSLSVHPLVQSWCQDLSMMEDLDANIRTARLVLALSADQERHQDSSIHRQLLLPHINAALAVSSSQRVHAAVATRFARALRSMGQYGTAEQLWLDIVREQTAQLGQEHQDTLRSMRHLAHTYSRQGRYEEARVILLEVVEVQKRVSGPTYNNTLLSMNDLALTSFEQGRYQDAEVLQLEVLEIHKRKLGARHPSTLADMNNLAITYSRRGRYEVAEVLQREVLEIQKRDLEPRHPDMLRSMNNLAFISSRQGRYEEAEVLQLEVLEIQKHILGPTHPSTLTSMNNLGTTHLRQGRWEDAKLLQLEVLEIQKHVLGPTHPSTLTSMNNLATTLSKQGKLEEAAALITKAMQGRQDRLGEEHPDVLSSMESLALIQAQLSRRVLLTGQTESPSETSRTTSKSWKWWWRIFMNPSILWKGKVESVHILPIQSS